MPATADALALARAAADAASEKGAADLVLLDVSDQLALTDVFLVCSGATDRQVKAVVEGITDRLRDRGVRALRREGERELRWVLLDFGDVVCHVMDADERDYYRLESLWKDCPAVPWQDSALVGSPRAPTEADPAAPGG